MTTAVTVIGAIALAALAVGTTALIGVAGLRHQTRRPTASVSRFVRAVSVGSDGGLQGGPQDGDAAVRRLIAELLNESTTDRDAQVTDQGDNAVLPVHDDDTVTPPGGSGHSEGPLRVHGEGLPVDGDHPLESVQPLLDHELPPN